MSKTKISIYLIKRGITFDKIIKSGISSMSLSDGGTLYYKNDKESKPDWLDSFFPGEKLDLKARTVSAAIIYDVKVDDDADRFFVITFGFGRMLLDPVTIEERFGLITALNTINADMLRSVDLSSLDTNPLNSRIQTGNLAGVNAFNIDIDKTLLKSITGKTPVDWIESTISGSSSLSVTTDKTHITVTSLLQQCYKQYKAEVYKDHFKWIDKVHQVANSDLIKQLYEQLLNELNSDDCSNISFSVPEIIDWESSLQFKIKNDDCYDDVDIILLKTIFPKGFKKSTIFDNHLVLVDDRGENLHQWPIYRCISADLKYEEKRYILNYGTWFEIDEDFVADVESFYNITNITNDLDLPDYNTNSEQYYNKDVSEKQPDKLCLKDRKLERIGGDPIEVCDLYGKDKKLIHVKKYNGSAVLSHLFNQGLVSAESLFDKDFRNKVRAELTEGFELDEDFVASNYEIVYVIAKKDAKREKLPDIPFFSKVAFRNVAKRLMMYGYKVSILGIPYTYEKPVKKD